MNLLNGYQRMTFIDDRTEGHPVASVAGLVLGFAVVIAAPFVYHGAKAALESAHFPKPRLEYNTNYDSRGPFKLTIDGLSADDWAKYNFRPR